MTQWGAASTAFKRCPMCALTVSPSPEWEERPVIGMCPRCGVDLEVLACRHCSMPLMVASNMWSFNGENRMDVMPFCGHCGALTAPPREPQLRTKPAKQAPEKPYVAYAVDVVYGDETVAKVEGFEATSQAADDEDEDSDDD